MSDSTKLSASQRGKTPPSGPPPELDFAVEGMQVDRTFNSNDALVDQLLGGVAADDEPAPRTAAARTPIQRPIPRAQPGGDFRPVVRPGTRTAAPAPAPAEEEEGLPDLSDVLPELEEAPDLPIDDEPSVTAAPAPVAASAPARPRAAAPAPTPVAKPAPAPVAKPAAPPAPSPAPAANLTGAADSMAAALAELSAPTEQRRRPAPTEVPAPPPPRSVKGETKPAPQTGTELRGQTSIGLPICVMRESGHATFILAKGRFAQHLTTEFPEAANQPKGVPFCLPLATIEHHAQLFNAIVTREAAELRAKLIVLDTDRATLKRSMAPLRSLMKRLFRRG